MKELRRAIRQPDTVLFVGSGLSSWSGLPSWSELLEALARRLEELGIDASLVRREIQRPDLLQAASYGFDQLTKPQIGSFVRSMCQYGVARPHEVHRLLVALGPRCFVTTNYDDLLEQALTRWRPEQPMRCVTNRQLTETAEIVHAQATDFIFKPHGDASDADSIILTREQYRALMPHGDRHAALEAVRTLMVSRPVVYVGFGLRDPDFLYLRDVIANTYRGGVRDHFAIVADVEDQERDYWRRQYGVHLVGYQTVLRADGTRDHAPLLDLLGGLASAESEQGPACAPESALSAEEVLTLARSASRLCDVRPANPEFVVRVHARSENVRELVWPRPEYDHMAVDEFLDGDWKSAAVVGQPGSGKTYSLRRHAARLGRRVLDACMGTDAESFRHTPFPLLVDLKHYDGDLGALIADSLPTTLSLDRLASVLPVRILLDSFNEMPREILEAREYEEDFRETLAALDPASLVITSRTPDGVDSFASLVVYLDEVDAESALEALGQPTVGTTRLGPDIMYLLRRPIYFRLVAIWGIDLPSIHRPADLFASVFAKVDERFKGRFPDSAEIPSALLADLAYDVLSAGEEAFPIAMLHGRFKPGGGVHANEVSNWLVSEDLIIPHRGQRVAFVHQSMTEYLAARRLAERFSVDRAVLDRKLESRRWDQALYVCLSILSRDDAAAFLERIIEVDFETALRAVRFLEFDRSAVVRRLLEELVARNVSSLNTGMGLSWVVCDQLPVGAEHESLIWELALSGGILGSAAVQLLSRLDVDFDRERLLCLLVDRPDDYNLCANGVGRLLSRDVTVADAEFVARWATDLDEGLVAEGEDGVSGFISGAARMLGALGLDDALAVLVPEGKELGPVLSAVVCGILQDAETERALEVACELLLRGVDGVEVSLYFIGAFGLGGEGDWRPFTEAHAMRLVEIAERPRDGVSGAEWALQALALACRARPDLAACVGRIAVTRPVVCRAVLEWVAQRCGHDAVLDALVIWADHGDPVGDRVDWIRAVDLTWEGREALFARLVLAGNPSLLAGLLGSSNPPEVRGLGEVDFGDVHEFLGVLREVCVVSKLGWCAWQLGAVAAQHGSTDFTEAVLAELGQEGSPYRSLIAQCMVTHIRGATTDALSAEARTFLLRDLFEGGPRHAERHPLAHLSTQAFAMGSLVPETESDDAIRAETARRVLEVIGERHGRRYLVAS